MENLKWFQRLESNGLKPLLVENQGMACPLGIPKRMDCGGIKDRSGRTEEGAGGDEQPPPECSIYRFCTNDPQCRSTVGTQFYFSGISVRRM
jgi:hypothetical protein